jgi:group I intron endonuclease
MPYGFIYKIEFPNGKHYIGLTDSLERRKKEHNNSTKKGDTKLVYNALRKYNMIDAFELIEIDTADTLVELCEKEKKYIKDYNSHYIDGYGYNMTYGGEGTNGYIFTEQDKQKMSESQQKRFKNPEQRQMLHDQSKNYWNDNEEARKHMSELKKETCTQEWRRAQSEIITNTFKNNPDLTKQHSERMKQKHIDNPELAKQHSERMKQKYIDNPELARQNGEKLKEAYAKNPDLRIKNSEAQKKRFENPEEKEKLSRIHKERFKDNPNAKIKCSKGEHKPFIVSDKKSGEFIGSYDYKFQAIDDLKNRFNIIVYSGNIHKALEGKSKTVKGMIFKYKTNIYNNE